LSNTRAPIALNIPQHGYEELAQLAKHAGKLHDVVAVSGEIPLEANPVQISNAVAERIGVNPEVAASILSGLGTLHSMMRKSESTAEEIIEAISQTLLVSNATGAEEWRQKNIETWKAAIPLVASAISSITQDPTQKIFLRQKAIELMYAHQNIFRRCQIMTDLRPVYNSAGDTIHAMVLTHVLSVEYYDGVRRQRIEFALDGEDIDNLRKSAERAKVKTDAAKKKFSQLDWPLMIAGDASPTE
jgi:hypothetical protein